MHIFVRVVGFLTLALTTEFGMGQGTERTLADSLRFLIGDWEAIQKPGQGTGYSLFSSELGGRVVVRKNHAEYPASEGRPAGTHDDLMMVYTEGTPPVCRATYVDTEGHAIRYTGRIESDSRVIFVSDAQAGEPHYRLSYTRLPDGTLGGKFEMAPPGKPDQFATYLEWTARLRGAQNTR